MNDFLGALFDDPDMGDQKKCVECKFFSKEYPWICTLWFGRPQNPCDDACSLYEPCDSDPE